MTYMDSCPYCGYTLTDSPVQMVASPELDKQKWMNEAWQTLLRPTNVHIEPEDTAMRLLYLFCGKQAIFERKRAEVGFPNTSVLPTLLQHARESLSQKRTLHLSFLLNTLYEHGVSLQEFLHTVVPPTFVQSLRQGSIRKVDRLSCQAPWCSGYQKPATLVKTGTTRRKHKSGEILVYYLACVECGCEYAIDEQGRMKERTYFVDAYRRLQELDVVMGGMKETARQIGFTEDKLRRCLAYFCTRQGVKPFGADPYEVDGELLQDVLRAVNQGTPLKNIQAWSCWESYQQFLIYRFHPEIMRSLIELKRVRWSTRTDSAVKRQRVREVLDGLLETDDDITIASVCSVVGVCPETIRSWGCNTDIAQAKKIQRERRLARLKESFYEKTDEYLTRNAFRRVKSSELHEYLGIGRTILWRTAPEVAAYIAERIRVHNTRA